MSDNLESNIKQIAELLSKDEVADSLKKLLSGLLTSKAGQEEKPKEQNERQAVNDKLSKGDMRKIENIVRAVSELRETNDPGISLLTSLKPFLRQSRRKALGDSIKLLQMARVFEYMREHDDASDI
jgi:hypothetical protein